MEPTDFDNELDISIPRENNTHEVRLTRGVAAALHWASRHRTGSMHCVCEKDGSVKLFFQKPQDATMAKIMFR